MGDNDEVEEDEEEKEGCSDGAVGRSSPLTLLRPNTRCLWLQREAKCVNQSPLGSCEFS